MNVTAIAEQMVAAIEQPYRLKEQDFYVTVSIGIAFFPCHGQNEVQLLKNADTAMYEVKKTVKMITSFSQTIWMSSCSSGLKWKAICGKRWSAASLFCTTSRKSGRITMKLSE